MKRAAVLAAAPLLALAACAGPAERGAASQAALTPAAATNLIVVSAPASAEAAPPAAGPEDALILPVRYLCQDGAEFSALFPAHGRTVTVTVAGVTRTLDLVESADTPFYRRDGVQLAAEGADAVLSGGGLDYSGCAAG